MHLHKNKYYIISFTEGAAVMAAEICGAKLLAPFYGSSLYVWSSVMAITLGGLAAGYFIGGKLSKLFNKEKIMLCVLIFAVTCLCLMPNILQLFYVFATYFTLIPAVIFSVFFLLFPTMIFMGATSPLIISILTQDVSCSGETSGKVYAISTIGGIAATFLCGFYFIPHYGIKITLLTFAVLLAISSLVLMPTILNKKLFFIFIAPLSFCLLGFINNTQNKFTIYKSEGMLGKIEIRDEPDHTISGNTIRKLFVNNIVQTEMDMLNFISVSDYVKLLNNNVTHLPHGKVLILGLGGGMVANMLVKQNYKVTAVEFDERIIEMAKHFFYLNRNIETVCDDARHFINSSNEKYNLIMFDIFKAEEQPAHVITKESLQKIKILLDDSGVIIINSNGYLNSKNGKGTHCLVATLKDAGFHIKICPTIGKEDFRNILIFASIKPFDYTLDKELSLIVFKNLETINTDNYPILDYLSADANQAWRTNYLKNYILQN